MVSLLVVLHSQLFDEVNPVLFDLQLILLLILQFNLATLLEVNLLGHQLELTFSVALVLQRIHVVTLAQHVGVGL